MLTLEKLNIFEEFNGDIDGWTRMRRDTGDTHDTLMTAADWSLLDRLVMDLGIAGSGLVSAKFRAEIEERLHENTADETTRAAVRGLAVRLNRKNRC